MVGGGARVRLPSVGACACPHMGQRCVQPREKHVNLGPMRSSPLSQLREAGGQGHCRTV
jgi:hypothetical protein